MIRRKPNLISNDLYSIENDLKTLVEAESYDDEVIFRVCGINNSGNAVSDDTTRISILPSVMPEIVSGSYIYVGIGYQAKIAIYSSKSVNSGNLLVQKPDTYNRPETWYTGLIDIPDGYDGNFINICIAKENEYSTDISNDLANIGKYVKFIPGPINNFAKLSNDLLSVKTETLEIVENIEDNIQTIINSANVSKYALRTGRILNNGNHSTSYNNYVDCTGDSMKLVRTGDYVVCPKPYSCRLFFYELSALSSTYVKDSTTDFASGVIRLDNYAGLYCGITLYNTTKPDADISNEISSVEELISYVSLNGEISALKDEIDKKDIYLKLNADSSNDNVIVIPFGRGTVVTANNDDSGVISYITNTNVVSDEVYVGNLNTIILTPSNDISFRVACYDEDHRYIRTKSIRGEQTVSNTIVISDRPKTLIKYIRVNLKYIASTPILTDEDVITIISKLTIKVTTNSARYFNPAALNNKLINSMSHQGYNLTSNSHGNLNRITSFWGAYMRGFDTLLCNVRFTHDGIGVLNHDPSITINETSYTIVDTDYSVLTDAFETINSYLPTFDDICYLAKMCGMEIFIANEMSGKNLNNIYSILKTYRMHKHVYWLASDSNIDAILSKDNKAKLYFYAQPSGSTKEAIVNSIVTLVSTINNRAITFPDATFSLWLETVIVNDSAEIFAEAIANINMTLENNVEMGLCNVNSGSTYVTVAPYINSFHSDFISSGNCINLAEAAVLEKFPIIGEYYRNK